MDEAVAIIAKDFPILGILLVVLIGQHRLANRIIDLLDAHLNKLIDAQEAIADELKRKPAQTPQVRGGDSSSR